MTSEDPYTREGSEKSPAAADVVHKERLLSNTWPPFTTLLSKAQGVPVLNISGDIMLYTEPQFRAALKMALDEVERTEAAGRVLVMDFWDVQFVDSVGLGILIEVTEELRKLGGEVRLVTPPGGRVRRILKATGLVDMFRVYSDVLSAAEERRGGAG